MRGLTLISNALVYAQLLGAYAALDVQWSGILGPVIDKVAYLNLDFSWAEDLLRHQQPLGYEALALVALSLFPPVLLFVTLMFVWLLSHPQMALGILGFVPALLIAMSLAGIIKYVAIGACGLLVLVNPITVCIFRDRKSSLRLLQDAFPPLWLLVYGGVAYVSREDTLNGTTDHVDVSLGIYPPALFGLSVGLCAFSLVGTVSIALQRSKYGRDDRDGYCCRLGTFMGKQITALFFAVFTACIVPYFTLLAHTQTTLEYRCPEGTLFNPFAVRPPGQRYTTAADVFCDRCDFVGGPCSVPTPTANGSTCPAWQHETLASDPMAVTTAWAHGALTSPLLIWGFYILLMMMLLLAVMAVVVRRLRRYFDEDTDHIASTFQAVRLAFANDGDGATIETDDSERVARWDFICDHIDAQAVGLLSEYRAPLWAVGFVVDLLFKVAIIGATIPLAPRHTDAALGIVLVLHLAHAAYVFLLRPYRDTALIVLTGVQSICLAAIAAAGFTATGGRKLPAVLGAILVALAALAPYVAAGISKYRMVRKRVKSKEHGKVVSFVRGWEAQGCRSPTSSSTGGYDRSLLLYSHVQHSGHERGHIEVDGGGHQGVSTITQDDGPGSPQSPYQQQPGGYGADAPPTALELVAGRLNRLTRWAILVPATLGLIGGSVLCVVAFIHAAADQDIGLQSNAAFVYAGPTTMDQFQAFVYATNVIDGCVGARAQQPQQTSAPTIDPSAPKCCLVSNTTNMRGMEVVERWVWYDSIVTKQRRVLSHPRVATQSPSGTGLPVRAACSPGFRCSSGCSLSPPTDPNAFVTGPYTEGYGIECSGPVPGASAYAVQHLW